MRNTSTTTISPYLRYYPFGMGMPNRSWSVTSDEEYRFGFNGKESDKETYGAGNIYDYGFRIYNPRLGKFLSVDPIARQFSNLSPYQFASNTPIMAVDLDGLEAKVAIAGNGGAGTLYETHPEDAKVFKERADILANNNQWYVPAVQVTNGKELINALVTVTNQKGSIGTLVIYSHGTSQGITLDWDNGFFINEYGFYKGPNSATVGDLKNKLESGEIKFEMNAVIVFASCNANAPVDMSIAREITNETGITTVAAFGNVEPEVVDGKETGRLVTDGNFYKIDKIFDVTYKLNGKTYSKSFTNSEEANYYRDSVNEEHNVRAKINSRIVETDLGTVIEPTQF